MNQLQATPQWSLTITVFHSANSGHSIGLRTSSRGRGSNTYPGGTWKGLGIPDEVLRSVRARVDGVLTEHLISRYGVAGQLPLKWSGEPDYK